MGDVNKLFVFKSLLTTASNVLPLHLKQTFPPTIWIFTEGVGDWIESRLPFKIFSTLKWIFQAGIHWRIECFLAFSAKLRILWKLVGIFLSWYNTKIIFFMVSWVASFGDQKPNMNWPICLLMWEVARFLFGQWH